MSAQGDLFRVFVSFSSRDGLPSAMRLAEWLRTVVGASPYLYYEQVAGDHFPTRIQRAIRECRVLIAILTPGYAEDESVICQQEVAAARRLNRWIIPVRMIPGDDVPLLLTSNVRFDLTGDNHPDWVRLEWELRRQASPEHQLEELSKERDLWKDRRPPPGPLRQLWETAVLAPVQRQIADKERRLQPDAQRDLTSELATERTARQRSHGGNGVHTRFLSTPPAFVPLEFQDRILLRDQLLTTISSNDHRFVLLLGDPGSGKTAILAKLAEAFHGPAGASIDWFAYLPAFGQHEVSTASVLSAMARIADGDDPHRGSQELLHDSGVNWLDAADAILSRLGTQRVVLVLDNVELLTGDDGRLTDMELGRLLRRIGSEDNCVSFVLSSAKSVDLRPIPDRLIERIPIEPGLEPKDGAKLLQSLDPEGLRGLGSAADFERRHLSVLGLGHPRTLELIAALLYCDDRVTIADLINGLEFDRGEATPSAHLLDRIMDALPELDRAVLAALAVFSEPVPSVAVDFLLAPYLSNVESLSTLELLSNCRVIRAHEGRYYLQSADEGEIILSGVPSGDLDEDDEDAFRWSRTDLALVAAEYYMSVASREPARVEDVGPQFSEAEQRIRGHDPVGAAVVLQEIDERCLQSWGQTFLAMPWLRRLLAQLVEPEYRIPIVSMLANGHLQVGEYLEAAELIREAEPMVSALPPDRAVQFYVQAGSTAYQHGQVTEAANHYGRALEMADREDSLNIFGAQSGLMLCAAGGGDIRGANEHLSAARRALSQNPAESTSLAAQLDLNEAWLRGLEGEHVRARECWVSARRISRSREHSDAELEAWTYCMEASLVLDQGSFTDAVNAAQHAIDLASPSRNMRILREAKNRIVLAELCNDRVGVAVSEANFAISIVQRHGALPAFTLLGLAQLRLGDVNATSSLGRARSLAEDYLQVERRRVEVWDLLGVVLLAQSMQDPLTYESRMVAAFQEARRLTIAPGVVRRVHLLIDQVAQAFEAPLPERARRAASELLAF